MIKKIIYIFILSISLILPTKVYSVPYVNSRYALVLDSESLRILYNKNGFERVANASTTKIMTALVAIEKGDLNKKYIISKKASRVSGSSVGYKEGEEITLKELLYGLMLRSGNDAAIAIAEGIGGDENNFMNMVNDYIIQNGGKNTHFTSPHGLDNPLHYTTAYDLAYFTAKGMKNNIFREIVGTTDTNGDGFFTRSYHNINKILYLVKGANGVKTGYTGNAGKCLVSSINREGRDIIYVLLNSEDRFNVTKALNDYIIKNYSFKTILKKGETVGEKEIIYGDSSLKVTINEDITLPILDGESLDYRIYIDGNSTIIKKGEKVGTIVVFKEDDIIYSASLYAQNDVKYKHKWREWLEKFQI